MRVKFLVFVRTKNYISINLIMDNIQSDSDDNFIAPNSSQQCDDACRPKLTIQKNTVEPEFITLEYEKHQLKRDYDDREGGDSGNESDDENSDSDSDYCDDIDDAKKSVGNFWKYTPLILTSILITATLFRRN